METYAEIKDRFASGKIDKATFITTMHSRHQVLFDASQQLLSSNVAQILIQAGQVLVSFRDPGITMICPPHDERIAPVEAFNFGDYEHCELQMLRSVVGMIGGSACHFVDVGANAGFYSLALSNYFPGIKVTAFEPISQTYQILTQNLDLNRPHNIAAINLGLSNQRANLVFYTYPHQSSAAGTSKNLNSAPATEVHCAVEKLDDYVDTTHQPVSVIKCDVEGAELFAFQGAIKTIQRDQPIIFTEMLRKWSAQNGYHPNAIIQMLRELGYSCFEIQRNRLKKLAEITDVTVSTNFFFCHDLKHSEVISTLAH